jgi:hypothetical protein
MRDRRNGSRWFNCQALSQLLGDAFAGAWPHRCVTLSTKPRDAPKETRVSLPASQETSQVAGLLGLMMPSRGAAPSRGLEGQRARTAVRHAPASHHKRPRGHLACFCQPPLKTSHRLRPTLTISVCNYQSTPSLCTRDNGHGKSVTPGSIVRCMLKHDPSNMSP